MEEKPWGTTSVVAREHDHHIDRIVVAPGGYCSVHKHAQKVNVFHVLTGRLYVRTFSVHGGTFSSAHMLPGDAFVVPAGLWHQFHAQNGGAEALELYLPGPDGVLEHSDIERHAGLAVGGVGSYGELASMLREAFQVQEQYVGR